jgi:ribosome-binding protein aMBF1 (putative translation factor)
MKKEYPPIKIHLRNSRDVHAQAMKDPVYKKAYDSLDLEFAIIDALIRARALQGMTQEKLAKKIGTKQSAIARFESGRANPTLAFVQKLSDALDIKITATPRYVKH